MTDNDLIRRGDAILALESVNTQRCGKCGLPRDNHYVWHLFVTTGFSHPITAISVIPSVQPATVTVEQAARVLLDDAGPVGNMMRKIVALAGTATDDYPERSALPIIIHASPTMGEARALRALAGGKPND